MRQLILLWLLAWPVSPQITQPQGWRGLLPMKSTCEDVKRVLPGATCKAPYETFTLGDEEIRIGFSEYPCYKAYQQYWDVPVGTVIIVERRLKKPIPLAEFHVDVSKCEKVFTDLESEVIYSCDGISYYTLNSEAHLIFYMPTKEDDRLECPKNDERINKRKGS